MAYQPKLTKTTVPVGMTPVPKYASWDEHREAIRRDVLTRRNEIEQQRVEAAL